MANPRATNNGPQQGIVWQNNTQGFLNINLPAGIIDGRQGVNTPSILTKAGAGTLQLQSSNFYTGATFVNEGDILFTSNAQLGDQPTARVVNLTGGALVGNATFNLDNGTNLRPVAVFPAGGTLAATTGNTMTIAGIVSGSGILTIGQGTVPGTGVGTANTTALVGNGTVTLTAQTRLLAEQN